MVHLKDDAVSVDPEHVADVSSRLAARLAPWKLGIVLAVAGALTAIVVNVLGVAPAWLPAGASGALSGAVAGFLIGLIAGLVRNLATTLYLRYLWTRLNHHEASDILDRLS